jgi:hypothetical protein
MRSLSASRSNLCDSLESVPASPFQLKTFLRLYLPEFREVQHEEFVAFCLLVITPAMLCAQSGADNPETKIVKLERGQVLDLSLVTPLDSAHAHVGDEISFQLERDLNANGLTVLPRNSAIHGRITKVVRAGKSCKSGRTRWKLEPLKTASGRKIKVQSIPVYLAKPHGDHVVDRVRLDTTGEKIARDTQYATMVPVVVLFSPIIVPWLILFTIATSGEGSCDGSRGQEETILSGTHFYAAVSKDTRLVPALASPHRCDTPETVTDSSISSTHCF